MAWGVKTIKLILARHAQTSWNQARLVQGGGSDIELDEAGIEQALRLAAALAKEPIQAIYASPMKRALQTTQPLAEALGLPIAVEPDLMEIDAGQADGLPVSQLKDKYPQFWQDWTDGDGPVRWPGGESLEEVARRTGRLMERLKVQHSQGTVLLVGHTFSLIVLLLQALGLGLGLFRRLRLDVASLSTLEVGPAGATLLTLNDTCHWKGT